MMRLVFILSLALLLAPGCKKGNSNNCLSETLEYHFKNNAKVDTLRVPPSSPSGYLIAVKASGTKRVFTYSAIYSSCPELIDGGSSQTVLFEVDPAATSFKFEGEDLQTARCYYQYGNVLYSPDAYIPAGSIEGTKINDQRWQVHINLTLKNNQSINISKVFIAK